MLVGTEALVQQFHQLCHLPDVVLTDIQTYASMDASAGQQADVLQHTLKGIHVPIDVVLHAVVGLCSAVEGNLHTLQLPQVLGTLSHFGIEQIAVGNHLRAERHTLLAEFRANLVDGLGVDQRLAAKPTDMDSLAATVCHDVAHHLAGRLGGHGDGLRALLEAVEAAGIAARSGKNGIVGDCLGGGLEEGCHLPDLSAELLVVVLLRH